MGKIYVLVFTFKLVFLDCLVLFQASEDIQCDRELVGQEGVVSSYNFPLDYDNNLNCTYKHYFNEYEDDKVKQICFQFTRFGTELNYDYLDINGRRFSGQWDKTMELLCFSVAPKMHLKMNFKSDYSGVATGFYANYFVLQGGEKGQPSERNDKNGFPGTPYCFGRNSWPCFSGKKCINPYNLCRSRPYCDDESDITYAHARCSGSKGQQSSARACDFHMQNDATGPELGDYLIHVASGLQNSWILETSSSDSEYGPKSPHNDADWRSYYVRTNFQQQPHTSLALQITHNISNDVPSCLTFWYHMSGKDGGRLDVVWGENITSTPIWTRAGDFGNVWLKAEIERLPVPSDMDEILFNATRGGENRAQIALDDISLMPGKCHPNADFDLADDISCTFEMGLCRWSEENWVVTDEIFDDFTAGPPGAAQGRFYIKPTLGLNSTQELISPLVTKAVTQGCLILKAYSIFDDDRVHFAIRFRNKSDIRMGTAVVGDKYSWQIFRIFMTYSVHQAYQVVLSTEHGGIFLDEIAFIERSCSGLDYGICDYDQYRCDSFPSVDPCIPKTKTCDGYPDCLLGDDEKNCESCKGEAFHCKNQQCVSASSRCDGVSQCRDGSDEQDCESCQGEAFHCANHQCVPAGARCDGIRHCTDNSDERDCESCQGEAFHCQNQCQCVPGPSRCDGYTLCADGSDEQDCKSCQGEAFHCQNRQCVPGFSRCDGYTLCTDGSDEQDCKSCQGGAFLCRNLQCIFAFLRCDGHWDCTGGLDEQDCDYCIKGAFHCHNRECVPYSAQCDGIKQCSDGSDERHCSTGIAPGRIDLTKILSISISVIIILVIVITGVIFYKQRKKRTQERTNDHSLPQYPGDHAGDDNLSYSEIHFSQEPPDYYETINNLAFIPGMTNDSDLDKDLPSYEAVSSGNFVQITVPVEEEVEKMKRQMATRADQTDHRDELRSNQNSTNSSSSNTDQQNVPYRRKISRSLSSTGYNSDNGSESYVNPALEQDDVVSQNV